MRRTTYTNLKRTCGGMRNGELNGDDVVGDDDGKCRGGKGERENNNKNAGKLFLPFMRLNC